LEYEEGRYTAAHAGITSITIIPSGFNWDKAKDIEVEVLEQTKNKAPTIVTTVPSRSAVPPTPDSDLSQPRKHQQPVAASCVASLLTQKGKPTPETPLPPASTWTDEHQAERYQLTEEHARLLSLGYALESREFTQDGAVYRALVYTHMDWELHPSHLLISKSQGGQTTIIYRLQEERKISLVNYAPEGEQQLDWGDMNADGLMELPYTVYQGGNCWTCLQRQVLQIGADHHVVNLTELVPPEDSLGEEFALESLIDVDNDGVLEWQVIDARFELAFHLCHACSPHAVRLYAWDGKTYRNASAQFPDYYQQQIEDLTVRVEKVVQSDEPWTGYEVGPMVSLLLAYENAGRFEEGWQIFERISDPSQYTGRASEEQLQSLREARGFFG